MSLWLPWFNAVWQLRPAFSRAATCVWFALGVAGITVRTEHLGVTSLIRGLGLNPSCYGNFLGCFHSTGIDLHKLRTLWTQIVLKVFADPVLVNGRLVLVGDGLKNPKEGKKMPGVKKLHQESDSNTKPEWIMGHSLQAVSILARAMKRVFAVPLSVNIDEGIVWSNRDKRTLLDKMLTLVAGTGLQQPYYLVVDAYYAAQKMVCGLLKDDNHLVTRMKSNAVAYRPAVPGPKKRGRPRIYGKKVKLNSLPKGAKMQRAKISLYGQDNIEIEYRVYDLLWRPAGRIVRFVVVRYSSKKAIVLMCTDISLDAVEIVKLYGLRFKIEFSFKQAIRTIGAFGYHFWMAPMKPLERSNGNQYMHREPEEYRAAVRRKLMAYHVFMHAGVVAQGLMQYLSATFPDLVWQQFGSWLRTVRDGVPPSELVVANALRHSLPEFLQVGYESNISSKFLAKRWGKLSQQQKLLNFGAAA